MQKVHPQSQPISYIPLTLVKVENHPQNQEKETESLNQDYLDKDNSVLDNGAFSRVFIK